MLFRHILPAILSLALLLPGSASAQFELEVLVPGANFPVSMAFAPDGRLFYTEKQTGQIRVVDNDTLRPDPFATLPVNNSGERGLLGITFDPDYESNHYVYVFHTNPDPLTNRVVRLTDVDGYGEDPTIIFDVPINTGFTNHNGGNIHFGPDGKLYVTLGEYNVPSNSQDTSVAPGKIHRLNSDGSIPGDNPFPGNSIFAYGLRNSFDFSFHPINEKIYATENGPAFHDEVNIIIAGGNYGWPIVTGMANTPPFIDPIIEINPTTAPTGIIIYSGGVMPGLDLAMLFAEWNTGRIWNVTLGGDDFDEVLNMEILLDLDNLTDIEQGPDGFIYISGISTIRRYTYTPIICDVNADGVVDIFDLIRMINIALGIDPPPTPYELEVGDANGDGTIDILDVIICINIILGAGQQ